MLTIGQTAPQPVLEQWVQGHEPEIQQLLGQVILIEVIQVNCPGCFVHALPEAIRLHETYQAEGLKVFAIATAFEDFEHNTLNNLQRLLQHGQLQGAPLEQLAQADFLEDGNLPYAIPFSVAMDRIEENTEPVNRQTIEQFIVSQIPDFFENDWKPQRRHAIYQQAENYLMNKTHKALTFELYELQGTPSSILIDRNGHLHDIHCGIPGGLEDKVIQLLSR